MRYNCPECRYATEDSSNWTKHIKTKMHKRNMGEPEDNDYTKRPPPSIGKLSLGKRQVPDQFICNNCSDVFTTRQALSRHRLHRCTAVKEKKESDAHMQYLIKLNEILVQDKEFYKGLVTGAGNLAMTSVNALSFISQSYSNAPNLQPMASYATIKKYCGDNDIATSLIDLYKESKLVSYLGTILIDEYKKTNPQEQSVWNSDCSRLSYFVRVAIGDKSDWVADKGGLKIKDSIIKPLLFHIREEVEGFINNPALMTPNNIIRIENANLILQDIASLTSVGKSKICDELVKHIAPHFQLSRNALAITNIPAVVTTNAITEADTVTKSIVDTKAIGIESSGQLANPSGKLANPSGNAGIDKPVSKKIDK